MLVCYFLEGWPGNKQFQHPLGLRLHCFKRFKWNMNYRKILNVSNNFFMNRVLKQKSHMLAYFKVTWNEFAQQNTWRLYTSVYSNINPVKGINVLDGIKTFWFLAKYYLPYARHYNPRFVYFLPHFSVRFIIKSG